METLEYTCSKCDQTFCTKHRLPESHDCIGLKVEKAERYLKREEEETVPWFQNEDPSSNLEKTETVGGGTNASTGFGSKSERRLTALLIFLVMMAVLFTAFVL